MVNWLSCGASLPTLGCWCLTLGVVLWQRSPHWPLPVQGLTPRSPFITFSTQPHAFWLSCPYSQFNRYVFFSPPLHSSFSSLFHLPFPLAIPFDFPGLSYRFFYFIFNSLSSLSLLPLFFPLTIYTPLLPELFFTLSYPLYTSSSLLTQVMFVFSGFFPSIEVTFITHMCLFPPP